MIKLKKNVWPSLAFFKSLFASVPIRPRYQETIAGSLQRMPQSGETQALNRPDVRLGLDMRTGDKLRSA